MDHANVLAMLLFPLVVTVISVRPVVLHHWNQKDRESMRLIRSATSERSLDQARTQSVISCYGSQCVINEQFCDATIQMCAMCHYEKGECTANPDCFNFCSEKKAQEICTGQEGHTETTEILWWPFLLVALFIASVVANVYCIIDTYKMWKKEREDSETEMMDKDENNALVSNQNEDNGQVLVIHKESNKVDSPPGSPQFPQTLVTHPESDLYPHISPTGP